MQSLYKVFLINRGTQIQKFCSETGIPFEPECGLFLRKRDLLLFSLR